MASGTRLGSMYWEIGADNAGLQRGLEQSEQAVQRFGNQASGAFSALTVAAGTLLAAGIQKLASGIMSIGVNAISATADMQSMQVGMEGLLAREIARGEEATRSYQVVRSLNAEEQQQVTDLTLKLDQMNAKLQEKKQHLWEIQNRWTDEGLAAKTAAADIAVYENNIAKTAAALDALLGKQGQVNTVTEKYWINTTTISDAMPQAQERAKALMDELARISILSPYQVENVQNTFKMAMAFGYTADEATKFTKAILNVAAGTGATNEMLDRMAYNFAQVRMQGKVTAVDIRQLAMAGFDLNGVLRSVGEQFGVNIKNHEDFNAAIANGSITWEQFTDGFAKYADMQFGGAAERMSRTLNGLKSTFSDLFKLTLPKIVGPALEEVTGLLSDFLDSLLKIRETGVLDALGKKLGDAVGGIVRNIRDFAKLPGVIKQLTELDPNDFAGIYFVLEQLPEGMRGLAKGIAELVTSFEEGGLGGVFQELFSMASDWWETGGQQWLTDTVTAAWQWIQRVPGAVMDKAREVVENAKESLIHVWQAIYKWWDSGGGEWVTTTANTVWGYVTQLPGKIAEKVAGFVETAKAWLVDVWNGIHNWWDTGGAQWVSDTADKIWTWAQQIGGKISEKLTEGGMEVGQWLAGVWNNLNTWWDTGGQEWASETAGKIGAAVETLRATLTGEDAPEALKQAVFWLEPVWMQMADWWTDHADPLVTEMLAGFDNWMNASFVPALQNQDKSTWAAGVGQALLDGFSQAVDYLYQPANIERIAYAIGNWLTQVLIDISFLPLGLLQALWNSIFGGEQEVDTSQAKEWLSALLSGLLEGIGDAFTESPIIQEVMDWIGALLTAIGEALGIGGADETARSEKTFAMGQGLVNGLIAGIWDMDAALRKAINDFVLRALVQAVAWDQQLKQAGRDTIAGLLKGLEEKKNDVIKWVEGLVGGIIEAVKNLFNMRSPSLVMMELGRNIILGLIQGFQVTTPAAVQAMTDMIQQVMGALSAVTSGVGGLIDLGVIGDVGPALTALLKQLGVIMVAVEDLAGQYTPKQIEKILAVVEPLSSIFQGLGSALQVAENLLAVTIDPGALERAGAVVEVLMDLVHSLVKRMAGAGGSFTRDELVQAAMLAEVVAPVLEAFALAAEVAADLVRVSTATLGPKVDGLVTVMGRLIQKLVWLANSIPPGILTASAKAAETIIEALSPWKTMVSTFDALAGFVIRSGIGPKADAVAIVIERLIRKITWLANAVGEDMLTNSAEVGALITAALKPWKDMVAAYGLFADFVQTSGIGPKADALAQVTERLIRKITWLANAIGEDTLQNSARIAALIVDALSPWAKMIEVITALGTVQEIGEIGPKATMLTGAVELLALALATMVDRLGIETLEKAQRVGRMLSDVLAPWEKAIKLADEMRAWQIMPDLEDRMIRFARQWVTIIESLAVAVARLDGEGLALVADFGVALEAVVTGLSDALALALALPATWTEPVSWQSFVTWVQDVFVEFYNWINGWDDGGTRPPIPAFDGQGLDVLGRFGEVLGSLMSGLQAALQLALALPETWTQPPAWDDFVTWVQGVFLTFYNWINGWDDGGTRPPIPAFDGEGLDVLGRFGDVLGSLMAGLQAALQLALALPATWAEPPSWDAFAAWVQEAFVLFMDWVSENFPTPEDPDAPDQFGAIVGFGNALGALMNGLAAALALATSLPATWVTPDSWRAFRGWVQSVFLQFNGWVSENFPTPEDPEAPDQFGAITGFGDALGALMGGLSAALDLALALPATWAAPSEETWAAFFGFVTDVFDAFMLYVEENYPTDPESAGQFEPIAAFGGAMGAVFDGLVSALELFVNLANWAGPSSTFNTRLANFLSAVSGAISYIATYIANDPNLNPESMTSVAVFGEALSDLVGGLSDALDLFAQLADTDPGVYTESTLFQDRVGNLLLAIDGTLTAFNEYILGPHGDDWQDAADDFYTAIDDIFQVLRDALSLFIDLEENGMPPTPEIQAFVTAITDLFDTVATQLGGLAQPGGALTLAIAAVDGVVSGFPATMDTYQQAWWNAAGNLAARIPAGLLSKVGVVGDPGSAGTVWGALGHISWTLDQWTPGTTMLASYFQKGSDLAAQLVAGMLSQVTNMYNAGEALAQSGLDGFAAGAGLGNVMEGMLMDAGDGGGWTMDTTHRWEISLVGVGSPTGYDLSFAAVDQITDMLRTKLARGG